ncbi:hypothetical protein A2U01_0048787, partial [Trifolium medium]|nr:hypothetical protein [Trifolium medium]
ETSSLAGEDELEYPVEDLEGDSIIESAIFLGWNTRSP